MKMNATFSLVSGGVRQLPPPPEQSDPSQRDAQTQEGSQEAACARQRLPGRQFGLGVRVRPGIHADRRRRPLQARRKRDLVTWEFGLRVYSSTPMYVN
ncbi:hypothetical protein CEXT_210361 [Caerostris extrusa]|uniref:Uncharacterized protein n=1 Tax=Caerostris extrusa TaxID=172846 RepID=A0AAV4P967_CAEEX|nr:hypothetical protein CEXT_210361 [Caerostris extrusa]